MSLPPVTTTSVQTTQSSSRQQIYVIGAVVGLLIGVLSAYMYDRAAGDTTLPPGANRVKSGELIGLALALLAIVRQVAELGRPDLKNTRRR